MRLLHVFCCKTERMELFFSPSVLCAIFGSVSPSHLVTVLMFMGLDTDASTGPRSMHTNKHYCLVCDADACTVLRCTSCATVLHMWLQLCREPAARPVHRLPHATSASKSITSKATAIQSWMLRTNSRAWTYAVDYKRLACSAAVQGLCT
jgi:hypothetical protein